MPDAGPPQPSARSPVYAVVIPAGGIGLLLLAAAAILGGVILIDEGSEVIVLVAAAITTAILVQPALRWLDRRMPSALAYVIVVLVVLGVIVGLVAIVTWDLDRQVDTLSTALTDAVGQLRAGTVPARVADSLSLGERTASALDGAAARWVIGTDDPIAVAGLVARVVVIAALSAFMLAGGDQILDGSIAAVRRTSIRQTLHDLRRVGAARAGSFVRRTLAVSVSHGVVVALVAWVFDLPGPVSLGAWAACLVTVPIVGGPLAWLPLAGVAWAEHAHAWLLVAVAVVAVVADRWARRWWVQRPLRLGPLLALIGLVGGYTVLGSLLGRWAAAWNLIPQVGGFLGAAPLVALGLAQSPWAGIVALVVFLVYQTFENHVIQPLVNSRAVHIPPLLMMIGVLVGGTLGGFVGAVLAGPILGVGKIVIGEWRGPLPARLEDRVAP